MSPTRCRRVIPFRFIFSIMVFNSSISLSFLLVNDSLNGFSFQVLDGEKQVSTDGGVTWENFTKALSSYGQGKNNYSTPSSTLTITAAQDYDNAILVITGGSVTVTSITTSGSGECTLLPSGQPGLINCVNLEKIKSGDTITVKSGNSATRWQYGIWY